MEFDFFLEVEVEDFIETRCFSKHQNCLLHKSFQ